MSIKIEQRQVIVEDFYGYSLEPVSGGWMLRREGLQVWLSQEEIPVLIDVLSRCVVGQVAEQMAEGD